MPAVDRITVICGRCWDVREIDYPHEDEGRRVPCHKCSGVMQCMTLEQEQAREIACTLDELTVAGAAPVAALVRGGKLDEGLALLGDLVEAIPADAGKVYDELHSLVTFGRAW